MKNNLRLLYNPFDRVAGWKAFFIGSIVVCVSVIIACYGNQYYQGSMNIRMVYQADLGYAFLSQAVSLLCLVLLFYIAGSVFSRGVRFQDVLGTATLARYPYIIPAFFGYYIDQDRLNEIITSLIPGNMVGNMSGITTIMIIAVIMLIVLVWYLALLWNAFRVSTDIKGPKGVVIFITALVMTDVFTYLILWLFNEFIA